MRHQGEVLTLDPTYRVSVRGMLQVGFSLENVPDTNVPDTNVPGTNVPVSASKLLDAYTGILSS